MDTLKYVIKRLLLAVLILFGVSVIIYSLARMMPSDFVDQTYQGALQQGTMTQEDIDRIKELYGLNLPDAYLTLTIGEGSAFSGEKFEKNTKETVYSDVELGALSHAEWYSGNYDGNHGSSLKIDDADRVSFKLNGQTYSCKVKNTGELYTPFGGVENVPFKRNGSTTDRTIYGSWEGNDYTRYGNPRGVLTLGATGGTYSVEGTEYVLEEYSLGGTLQLGKTEEVQVVSIIQDFTTDENGEVQLIVDDNGDPVMIEWTQTRYDFIAHETGVYFINAGADGVPGMTIALSEAEEEEQDADPVQTSAAVRYRVATFWDKAGAIFKSYFNWLGRLLKGDMGQSFKYKRPVADVIMENMGLSFAIAFIATILQFAIAIPLGIKAAVHQYGVVDYTVTIFTMMGISLPTFFLAAIVIRVFAVGLNWFEVGGIASASMPVGAPLIVQLGDNLWHMVLPMFVLVVLSIGSLMRYTRTNTLEALNADYVRTARAKGLSERTVIYKHAFRNTMVPLVTLLAGVLPSLFGGAMITETVFSIPGIGKLAYDALVAADVPFIMGYNMFLAVLTVLGMLLSDLLYGVVDPRVKIGK